ncbi:hypothetical protein MN116_002811 [Schistosoma mekongi]|uniref:UPAR/Ly6 domain-containing protein n=1 Tax=Schistosoma mekongi TaxID=38744 RepID=A0AAE2D6X7_SCHME|nr:hypothetical protein MN116_002811 [Schistosoma mekongi]
MLLCIYIENYNISEKSPTTVGKSELAYIITKMRHISQALLVIFLIVVTTDYSMQLDCYECTSCPDPFNNSSSRVYKRSSCKWCAKLLVAQGHITIRKCSADCSFQYFSKEYSQLSYYCCQTDYCNKGVNTHGMHRILLMLIIVFICFFINKKK